MALVVACTSSSLPTGAHAAEAEPPQESPFKVTIETDRTLYTPTQLKSGVEIVFTVSNVSDQPQDVNTWLCSYWENWVVDSEHLRIRDWFCAKDGLTSRPLQPGQKFVGRFSVMTDMSDPRGMHQFRLGFVPYADRSGKQPREGSPFWSNLLRLRILDDA